MCPSFEIGRADLRVGQQLGAGARHLIRPVAST